MIKGVVFDVIGEFLIGVSVLVKGIIFGIIIDIDGSYQFVVLEGVEMFVFSYIGFILQEIIIGIFSVIDVFFQEGLVLNEVIVMVQGI